MKHVVITGANRGIGLELANYYQAEDWRVTGVCRETSSELEKLATQVIDRIDVTSKENIERLAALLQGQRIDLQERGIAVAQLHPGFVKTRMVNFGGMITTEESVAGLAARIAALNLENWGSFWHCNGDELPW